MRTFLILFCLGFFQSNIFAQNKQTVNSTISNVTVYQQGAEITRQTNIFLKKGTTTLTFDGLSSKLDAKSIQAQGNNKLMIVSVSHQIDYLNKTIVSENIQKLEEKQLALSDSLSFLKKIAQVYEQEKDMILANKKIGGDNGVAISELANGATFFRNRLIEIETKSNQLKKQDYKLKLELISISQQLLELNAKTNLPTSLVKVVVSAKADAKYNLKLKYIVNDAGWTPGYDIRIDEVDAPLQLSYKAKVYQNTDEDWRNVKMILSTGNPSVSNHKPELETYYLTFDNYYKNQSTVNTYSTTPFLGRVSGKITDSNGDVLPGANVMVKGTTVGTISDIDGNYQLQIPSGHNILEFSYIGYISQENVINSGTINISLEEDGMELEEIVVVGYGSNNPLNRLAGSVAGINISKKKEQIPLAIEKRQTSTEFEIEIPYDIPPDNTPYDVNMIEYSIPAQYNYSTTPKLSEEAYLTAKIADWLQYELLSGSVNLFLQGIYQGETYLDLENSFEDSLSISVGIDKEILVERESLKDFTKTSSIGSDKKELKAWAINIKNNKNTSIELNVEDQFPISKENDIKVEYLETSGAFLNKDNGKLSWHLKLDPNEKKTLIIKYEVKYPKYRTLIVE